MALNANNIKAVVEKAAIARLAKTQASRSGHYLGPETPRGMIGNQGHHNSGQFAYGNQHGRSGKASVKNAGT